MNPELTKKVNNSDPHQVVDEVVEINRQSLYTTEMVELPSKGLVYPLESPLSSGLIEIKYMTTKEQDILSTESYIKTNVVLDKLLQSLIVNPLVVRVYDQLITGDKNALLIAARKYGFGDEDDIEVDTPSGNKQTVTINLNDLKSKEIEDWSIYKNENKFRFILPISKDEIEFKFITSKDERELTEKQKKYKTTGASTQLSDLLRKMIISVNNNDDVNFINLAVDRMLARDITALRSYIKKIQPNIDMTVELVDEATGEPFFAPITIGPSFFWPDL